MYSHVCLLLNWLLSRPISLCIGLFAFLIMILSLIHQETFIDAEGVPLRPMSARVKPMSPEMRELIDLARNTGWKKDPEIRARVMELSKSIDGKREIKNRSECHVKAVPLAGE